MSIQLPDLVQRIRVRTEDMRAAEKAADKLTAKLTALTDGSDRAEKSTGDLTNAEDDYTDSSKRATKVTAGAVDAIDRLDEAASRAGGSVGSMGDNTRSYTSSTDDASRSTGDFDASLRALSLSARNADNDTHDLDVHVGDLGDSSDGTGRSLRRLGSGAADAGAAMKIVSSILIGIKLPAIAGGLSLIASALTALTAGAVALTSQLGPLVGVLAGIPALAVSFVSLKVAFSAISKGIAPALDAINKFGAGSQEAADAMAAVKGPGLGFVQAFASMRGAIDKFNKAVANAALPGLTQALLKIKPLITALQTPFVKLGEVIGNFANDFAQMITRGPFAKDLGIILARNNKLVDTFGKAILRLVSFIRTIAVVAGPMVQALGDMILQFFKFIDLAAKSGRETGRLAAFFQNTLRTMTAWGHALRDLGVGLYNVFVGGSKQGRSLLRSFQRITAEFAAWSGSLRGQNAISQFFKDARPALRQTGKLIGAVFLAFGELGTDSNIAPLIKSLRKDLLPAILDLVQGINENGLGQALINLAVAFLRVVNVLSFNPFITVIGGLTAFIGTVAKAAGSVPILGDIVAVLLAIRTASKIASLAGSATGIAQLGNAISAIGPAGKAGERGIKGFLQGFRGAKGSEKTALTFANKIGNGLYKGIAGGLTKAKGLLTGLTGIIDRSLGRGAPSLKARAAKLGGVITTGLKTGFTKTKDVGKKALDGVIAGLKSGGKLAVRAGKGIADGFSRGLSAVKTGAAAAISGLGKVFGSLVGPIKAAAVAVKAFTVSLLTNPVFLVIAGIVALVAALVLLYKKNETFRNIVNAVWKEIGAVIGTTVKVVVTVIKAAWDFIQTITSGLVNFVRDHWQLLLTFITGPIGLAVRFIITHWNQIKAVFSTTMKFIAGLVRTYFTTYVKIIRAVISGAVSVVKKVWGFIVTVFRTYLAAVRKVVQTGISLVVKYIIDPIRRLVDIMRAAWDRIREVIATAIVRIVQVAIRLKDRILGLFADAGRWLYNIGRDIVTGLINGVKSMFGPVQTVFNWITDKIPDWKGPISKDRVLLYDTGVAIMTGLSNGIESQRDGLKRQLSGVGEDLGSALRTSIESQRDGLTKLWQTLAEDAQTGFTINPQVSGDRPLNQLKDTSQALLAQQRLMKKARDAAEKENRLRAQLPLLAGVDKKQAIQQIRDLQAIQEKAVNQSKGVRQVADLRKTRQAALKAADDAAVKAQRLRSKLPGLTGDDRTKAIAQIKELDKARKDELQNAKKAQSDLIVLFQSLPKPIRELLRDAKSDVQAKKAKAKAEAKAAKKGTGSGGGIGGSGLGASPSAPLWTKSQVPAGEKERTKAEREARRDRKRVNTLVQSLQHNLPPDMRATATGVKQIKASVERESAKGIAANAKTSRLTAKDIRDSVNKARDRAKDDAAKIRENNTRLSSALRSKIRGLEDGIVNRSEIDTTRIVTAIGQLRNQPPPSAAGPGGRRRGGTGDGSPPTSRTTNVTINNPTGQTSEESIQRRLRHAELLAG